MENQKILVVEDETDIRELIHFHLFRNKFDVVEAANGFDAITAAKKIKPSLIILDIMLPEMSGLQVCEALKKDKETENIKIIFLSAKGSEEDIVKGLELGADDYITKPFSPKILIARVKTILRRDQKMAIAPAFINIHGISVDDKRKKVTSDEKEISLTATEYHILKHLISSPGHVFTRSQIVNTIRGVNHAVTDRSIDTQLVSLRKKLGEKGKLIETVWGIGYKFTEAQT